MNTMLAALRKAKSLRPRLYLGPFMMWRATLPATVAPMTATTPRPPIAASSRNTVDSNSLNLLDAARWAWLLSFCQTLRLAANTCL